MSRGAWAATTAALLVLVLALALPTLRYDFVSDDSRLIVHNSWLDQGSALDAFRRDYYAVPEDGTRLGYYRPLTLLSNRLDFALWRRNAPGWHVSNWLFHLAVCVLLWRLGWVLLGRAVAAGLAALLFASSPVHTESVVFVSGRVDVLASGFGLAMVAAAWSRRPVLAALLWLPALLSKEVAVMFAPLAALLIFGLSSEPRGERARRVARLALCCVPVFVVYLALRLHAVGALTPRHQPSALAESAARVLNVHAFYWRALLVPSGEFAIEPPLPGGESWSAARCALALAPLLAGALLLARARDRHLRVLGVGLVWVTVALLPVSQFVLLETAVSPRYLYAASLGFALAQGALLGRLGRPGLVLGLALVAVQGLQFARAAVHFRDPVAFHAARARIDPDNQATRLSLAGSLLAAGQGDAAWRELETIVARWPDNPQVRYQAGSLALARGDADAAARHLELAAREMSLVTGVHLELGRAELLRGDPAAAASAFRRALLADPTSVPAAVGRALASAAHAERGGDPCTAASAFAAARELAPEEPHLDALGPLVERLRELCAASPPR